MENQLQVIVKESGLEESKAQFIYQKFHNYFAIAAEWEATAKTIIVTDERQTDKMDMARKGWLILREKRIAVEKARKELKEQALREGKAIDGIANVLKALIVPIEEHLERQEKFVEFKEAAEKAAKLAEMERRIEEERIAKEKADAEEREGIRLENERLKAEAIEREKVAEAERREAARVLAEQQRKAEADRRQRELGKEEEVFQEYRCNIQAQLDNVEEKARKERKEAEKMAAQERHEKERLATLLASQVECPFCHRKFNLTK